MKPELVEHRQIQLALKLSSKVEEIVSAPLTSHCLPPAAAADLKKAVDGFLSLQVALHRRFRDRGYFNVTIKSHYLSHIADYCLYLTPRAAWCYAGESFMNTAKRVVASCVAGTKATSVSSKATKKYLDGMAFAICDVPLEL